MFAKIKLEKIIFLFIFLLFISPTSAEEEESPEIIIEVDVRPPVEVLNDVEISTTRRQAYQIGDMYGNFEDGVEVSPDSG